MEVPADIKDGKIIDYISGNYFIEMLITFETYYTFLKRVQ